MEKTGQSKMPLEVNVKKSFEEFAKFSLDVAKLAGVIAYVVSYAVGKKLKEGTKHMIFHLSGAEHYKVTDDSESTFSYYVKLE